MTSTNRNLKDSVKLSNENIEQLDVDRPLSHTTHVCCPPSHQVRESPTSASVGNKRTPRSDRTSAESGSLTERGRQQSSNDKSQKQTSEDSSARSQENHLNNSNNVNNNNNNNSNNKNNNSSSPNSANKNRQGRETTTQPLRRAQTARGVRAAHSG